MAAPTWGSTSGSPVITLGGARIVGAVSDNAIASANAFLASGDNTLIGTAYGDYDGRLGLRTTNAVPSSYADFAFLLVPDGSGLIAFENGSGKAASGAIVLGTTTCAIRVANGVVTYLINGVVFYTSLTTATGTLYPAFEGQNSAAGFTAVDVSAAAAAYPIGVALFGLT